MNTAIKLLSAFLIVAFASQAIAQDAVSPIGQSYVSDRLERLERDIQTLNQQLSRMPLGAPSLPAVAPSLPAVLQSESVAPTVTSTIKEEDLPAGALDRILFRISKLEEEVRLSTDGMERIDHRFGLIENRLDTIFGDVDFRLSRLEGGNGGAPSRLNAAPGPASVNQQGPASGQAITPITGYSSNRSGQKGVLGSMGKKKMDHIMGQTDNEPGDDLGQSGTADANASMDVAIAPPQPVAPTLMYLPEGSVDEQYKHSFNLLRRAKYPEAEAAWKEFIAVHKDEKLAENARYWLGETYYVQKRFLDSAQAFLQSYQAAPAGVKAADSLLKLGKSMSNMDKKDEACAAYSKLRKEFSAISPNVLKTLNRETKALGCK